MKPVMSTDATPMAVVNNVIARELIDPSPDTGEAIDDLPLDALKATVYGMNHGQSLGELQPHAMRLASFAKDKAELVSAILQSHELDRLVANLESRAICEKVGHRALRRGDISCLEALAVLDRLDGEIAAGIVLLKKDSPALDSGSVMDKVNSNRQEVERDVQHKFTGTTPQGREIIRRSALAMLAAKAAAVVAAAARMSDNESAEQEASDGHGNH